MLELRCADDSENLKANHEANKNRKGTNTIQQLKKLHKNKSKNKRAIICAAGPGLKDHLMSIKDAQEKHGCKVFSIKTGKTLEAAGIKVDYNVHLDTKDTEIKYVYKSKGTNHLISTQCRPEIFEAYKGEKVTRYHSRTAADWAPALAVAAGSNTTLQAAALARFLGYEYIYIFGFDLSWDLDSTTHVTGDREMTLDTGEIIIDLKGGRKVKTTAVMVGACQEAYAALSAFGTQVEVVGDRLFSQYVNDMKTKGHCPINDQIHIYLTNRSNEKVVENIKKHPALQFSFPGRILPKDQWMGESRELAA